MHVVPIVLTLLAVSIFVLLPEKQEEEPKSDFVLPHKEWVKIRYG